MKVLQFCFWLQRCYNFVFYSEMLQFFLLQKFYNFVFGYRGVTILVLITEVLQFCFLFRDVTIFSFLGNSFTILLLVTGVLQFCFWFSDVTFFFFFWLRKFYSFVFGYRGVKILFLIKEVLLLIELCQSRQSGISLLRMLLRKQAEADAWVNCQKDEPEERVVVIKLYIHEYPWQIRWVSDTWSGSQEVRKVANELPEGGSAPLSRSISANWDPEYSTTQLSR